MSDRDLDALGSASLEERDAACTRLVERGPRVFGPLFGEREGRSRRLEPRTRYAFAAAVLGHRTRRVRERPEIDLDYSGALRGALVAIGEASGLLLGVDPHLEPALDVAEISIAARRVLPLELVDQLGLDWSHDRYGLVISNRGVSGEPPTCYRGPCRVRLTSLCATRETDFAGGDRLELELRVNLDFEWPVRPLGPPSVRLHSDEPVTARPEGPSGWRWRCQTGTRPMRPSTRRIGAIAGDVMCTFPERYEEVALESLDEGAAVAAGELELVIEGSGDDGCLLKMSASGDTGKLPRSMIRHLVPTTILGIDDSGNEALARVRQMHTYGGSAERQSDIRVGVGFDAEGFGPLRAMRLQLATGVVHQLYPVRFENVAVP